MDIKVATSLVNMHAKCGDIDNVLNSFNAMKNKDVRLWSAMVMGLGNHGYGDMTLDHFHIMIS